MCLHSELDNARRRREKRASSSNPTVTPGRLHRRPQQKLLRGRHPSRHQEVLLRASADKPRLEDDTPVMGRVGQRDGAEADRRKTAPCNAVHGKEPDWQMGNFQPCAAKPASPRGNHPMNGVLMDASFNSLPRRTCTVQYSTVTSWGRQPGLALFSTACGCSWTGKRGHDSAERPWLRLSLSTPGRTPQPGADRHGPRPWLPRGAQHSAALSSLFNASSMD